MTGIDSSRGDAGARPARGPAHGLGFAGGDIGSWSSGGDHDLVLANASLHWVPDHAGVRHPLVGGARAAVASSRCRSRPTPTTRPTASPARSRRPSRSGRRSAARRPPTRWRANVLAPEQYAILLDHLGAARQHVRLQVYGHTARLVGRRRRVGEGHVADPVLRRPPAELHEPFVDEYRRRLLAAIGDQAPYFYPFKRILFWASKP